MNNMTVESFMDKFQQKSDFVLQHKDYSLHVTFFENDYAISEEDSAYFDCRADYWKYNQKEEGVEPFFWPERMTIAGVIRYGRITD